jgi:hypothetical protein
VVIIEYVHLLPDGDFKRRSSLALERFKETGTAKFIAKAAINAYKSTLSVQSQVGSALRIEPNHNELVALVKAAHNIIDQCQMCMYQSFKLSLRGSYSNLTELFPHLPTKIATTLLFYINYSPYVVLKCDLYISVALPVSVDSSSTYQQLWSLQYLKISL